MAGEKILVVDDVPVVCAAFKKELGEAGYDVDSALSGEEAIKMAHVKPYRLIFIDMVMPGIDGVRTCKEIKGILPKTTLVFMTGKLDENTIYREVEFTKAGGELYYLYKPFAEGEILDVTKKILQ